MKFNEVNVGELSTIKAFSDKDGHAESRNNGKTYKLKTISLNDMCEKYSAPKNIDYLSIDTEGSEFNILNAFDFGKYNVKIISVEHNFTQNREKYMSF